MGPRLIIAIVIAIVIVIIIIGVSVYYGTRDEEADQKTSTEEIPVVVTSKSGKTYYFYPTWQAPGGRRIAYNKVKDSKKHIQWLLSKCDAKPACTGVSTRDPKPFLYVSKLPPREKWVQSWPNDQEMGIYTTQSY